MSTNKVDKKAWEGTIFSVTDIDTTGASSPEATAQALSGGHEKFNSLTLEEQERRINAVRKNASISISELTQV